MFNLNKFLIKFKNITPPDIEIRENLIDILQKHFNIILDKNNISVKNNIIFIKTKPIIKSKIFINRIKILELLKNKIKDIR